MAPLVKDSIVDKVTKQIIHNIIIDCYSPEGRLPTNEDLASQFGVGRSSIRESLKQLQALGVVVLRHGDGTYLAESINKKSGSVLVEQVVEVRRMIEVYSTMEAVYNSNPEINETLTELVKSMKDCTTIEEFVRYDRQFHYTISRSSNNSLISTYHTSLELLFDEVQKIIVRLPGSSDLALKYHEQILNAILSQDAEAAGAYAAEHIDSISEQVKQTLREGLLKIY